MNRNIAIVLYGNITYDGRVQKEINSLRRLNKNVVLICSDIAEDDKIENYDFEVIVERDRYTKKGSFYTLMNMLNFNKRVIEILVKKSVDYIHCNDLPTILLSKQLKKIGKIVYDAHELFPESQTNLLKRILWNIFEYFNLKNVYCVIQAEENRKHYFLEKHKKLLKRKRVYLLENYPLETALDCKIDYFKNKYKYEKKQKKIALYTGIIMRRRNILEIIKSVEQIDDLVFFCVGKYEDKEYLKEIQLYIKNKKLEDKIFLKPAIPNKEVLIITAQSDIAFVLYENINLNNYYCASNKLYECLNNGLKIITNNYPGIKQITKDIPNVYNIDSTSVEEITKGINHLLKINTQQKTKYFWESQENVIKQIYKD